MERHDIKKYFIIGLAMLTAFAPGCGKSGNKADYNAAQMMLTELNQRLPGSEFKTNLEESTVIPIKNNRYQVTLKDVTFSSDFAWVIGLFYKAAPLEKATLPYMETANVHFDQMVLAYNPENNDIRLCSFKNMNFEGDFPDFFEKNNSKKIGAFEIKKARIWIGNIIMDERNIDEKLESGDQNVQPSGSVSEIKLEFSGITKNNEDLLITLEIEKIQNAGKSKSHPAFDKYFVDKNCPPPDLAKILQQGLAIWDRTSQVDDVKISIKKNSVKWIDGNIENVSYSQFLKQDETGNAFKFGADVEIKNFQLSTPWKKEIELLTNIKELKYSFSIRHLSPGAVMVIIDFMKHAFKSRNQAYNPKEKETMLLVMRGWSEFMKSKPEATFALAPFKHYFGELSATLNVQFQGTFTPYIKVSVELPGIEQTLNKIQESGVLTQNTLKTILEAIKQYTVRKENGDAFMTMVFKPDQPGIVFLNGIPRGIKR